MALGNRRDVGEREKKLIKIHKLRTILLLEPDFNHMNKLLGKISMLNAGANGLLAKEQYGSRKDHNSQDQSLNKRLTYDVVRQKRVRCGMCSNDAKGCYDRITHISAGLALTRAGAPPSAVNSMLGTIQQLKHYIRTAYGVSELFFDAKDKENPVNGILQGNGAGLATWALVSTPIFDSLRK